ncbi:MAG: MarR family winged helix-turn-helix transcriptional regulator [Desulfitobacteriia bacterium]|jgi:DNA-binding MarR family transcriptional regulator
MLESKELAGLLDVLLSRLSLATENRKNLFANEFGITRQQFDALNIIYDKGQITMGQLCQEISSVCSTATDLVDKLEKAALVERVRDKKDRRIVRLKILPRGEKLVRSAREMRILELEAVLKTYQREEMINLISLLETLAEKLEV